ncbi:MAG TPA: SBBP repeat-containing protein, partial [Rhodanobacteraceae bacterium]
MFTKRAHPHRRFTASAIVLPLVAGAFLAVNGAASDPPPGGTRAAADYGGLPLVFEHVTDASRERFVARGAHYAISISVRGVQVILPARQPGATGTALDIGFIAAESSVAIRGAAPAETRIHHLRGGGSDQVDVPTFASVHLAGLYPGIDAIFHGNGRRLEYDLVVAPGADPGPMQMRIDGASRLSLDEHGDLVVSAGNGAITVHRPFAYQQTGGARTPIESEFRLSGANDVRIVVGDYDRARSLVVDPIVSYASWLGGSAAEQATALAVDAAGNAYVAGWTNSSDFPLVSPYDRSITKYDTDVFVSKLNSSGTALVWSTYLGAGSNTAPSVDRAYGIAIDAAGSAYVTGTTSGSDFPVSANAYQKGVPGGGSFVTKLAPAGNAIVYSTYVAGATANALAVDIAGNAYIAGGATSSFTTTSGALQRTAGSGATSFVLKLDATGGAAMFATFLGGSGGDEAKSIAVDSRGNAFVGGWTSSTDFPLVNAYQSAPRGRKDGFVAQIDGTGARLVYSTRLGGALDDSVNAIAIDANGYAYVAGETYSADFPVKDGFQMQKAGSLLINSSVGSAFVAKLSPAGNGLAYASFLGGEV